MSQKDHQSPPPAGTGGAESWLSPPKVLIVDDNADILNVVQRILSSHNYEIFTAVDGREALEVAYRELPDLILLDVMLPEIDGLTVCRQLKADPATSQTMIVLVTGRGSIEHRAEGLDSGADDYIPKPFHLTELLARVRSALRIKRLTDELREKNRQLVDSQRERLRSEKMATIGLLATGLAHEFNNIMSGISGYAQLAKKNPKFQEQLVDVALIQSERALELTGSLSTFYRPAVLNQRIEIATVIENALSLVAKELKDGKIELERKFQEVPDVLGSTGQIQEVILNLAINAIHAIDSGGRLEISLEEKEGRVQISISDNGCGITQKNLDKIFDPFFTTKGALGGGDSTGSGLGLSVSYNIVRAHGGSISVRSTVGQGTTFIVDLPAFMEPQGESHETGSPAVAGVRPGQTPAAANERWNALLVADGDEALREMAGQFLQAREVACAATWPEALEHASGKRFDFTILDLDLPGIPAPQDALAALWKIDPEARVILTSLKMPENDLLETAQKAWGHLLKPYTIENLAVMMFREAAPVL